LRASDPAFARRFRWRRRQEVLAERPSVRLSARAAGAFAEALARPAQVNERLAAALHQPRKFTWLALIVVSGLLGMTLAIVGLHIYEIVELENTTFGHGTLLAGQLEGMLLDAGLLLGPAAIVYLLAPRADVAKRSAIDAPLIDSSALVDHSE
jgi:hypothetical protein